MRDVLDRLPQCGQRSALLSLFSVAVLSLTGCDKIKIEQVGADPAPPVVVPNSGPTQGPATPVAAPVVAPPPVIPQPTAKEIVAAFLEKATQTGKIGDQDLVDVTQLTEGLEEVTTLRISGAQITNVGVARLSKFPKLVNVDLSSTLVNNDGLAVIKEMPELRSLGLSNTAIDDKGLELIGEQEGLRELNLSTCPITDAGLAKLGKLDNLELLDISNTRVTGSGLQNLRSNKKLKVFRAQHSTIRGEAMKFLAGCPIEELNVEATGMGDDGMSFIAKMSKMQRLTMGFCNVTDFGIKKMILMKDLESVSFRNNTAISNLLFEKLRRCTKLKTVDASGTRVTAIDVMNLEKLLPGCAITR